MTIDLNALSANEIADGVRSGTFSAEAVTQACLDRINAREDSVMAWEFLDPELVPVCEELANEGRRVIVAGLDMDYLGQPFERQMVKI